MRTMTRFLGTMALVAALAAGSGCAASGAAGSGSGNRDLITAEQLRELDDLSAYRAVQRLRPQWLRARGRSSIENQDAEGVRVYVDDVRQGGVESMRNLQVIDIEEIRFLDSREATTRFGIDHGNGAIVITTR
jgi:Arc/MetJ family transcription regulator